MKWIIYHCKDHTPKDGRCCSRLRFCTLEVLNHILHSTGPLLWILLSMLMGNFCESLCYASNQNMDFYRAWREKDLILTSQGDRKKNYKWNRASRLQNGFQTLGFCSSKSLWAVPSTLSSTSITATISSSTTKLVKLKCLEGDLKLLIWVRKRAECSQGPSAVTMPLPDLTPTLTTSVHTFLLIWSFFSFLCDLTSFDSSVQNLFHRNNSQFSNFILSYLGIKSRFLTNSILSFPF